MENVLGNLKGNICFIYINDIIIFSRAQEQYLCDLDAVFLKQQAHLTLNIQKCLLFKTELTFLGHAVSKRGVVVDQAKVDAIIAYPVPTDLKNL